MLQAVTSLISFRRTGKDTRLWHAFIAPMLGIIGPIGVGAVVLLNLDVLSSSSSPIVHVFPWILMLLTAIGISIALVVRWKRPSISAQFSQ